MIIPIIDKTLANNKVLGAICNASLFLGENGYLNDAKHTSNTLHVLQQWGKETYTGSKNYLNQQAVSNKNIVTANGTGYLEFTKEILLLLKVDTPEKIEKSYDFNKLGFVR